jgi:hypothetical protein
MVQVADCLEFYGASASPAVLQVIVLCFSTMMYIVEPKDNITSLCLD